MIDYKIFQVKIFFQCYHTLINLQIRWKMYLRLAKILTEYILMKLIPYWIKDTHEMICSI